MRTIIKHFIINIVSLYLISLAVNGIIFADGTFSIVMAGIVLTLTSIIIKPILNILLLPLNLITFGFFRWVGFAVSLYLVTLIVPGFKILDFAFKGYSSYWFSIPPIYIGGIMAFIIYSFLISLIASIAYWILK